ncbi:MAG: SusC/RagA family TonB-linked outer membrane protein [Paludibacter sp.]|nr:SusC/RagA family TonB-linked outer membrane protein [Paludibacter sp.]
MRKLTFLFACLFFVGVSVVLAQTSISGKVISAENGEEIVGATVMVKGTTTGTITNVDGNFTISLPGTNKTLVVSYVGMKTVEVQAAPNMVVKMESDTEVLEEVVVTALGISRKEKTLGYSATAVKGDEIAKMRNTDVMSSLSGKVAGLTIASTSSDPGAANSVVIRGFASINGSNQPLYVVNGVPIQDKSIDTQGHSISITGISNMSSEDIESMTVLKGAAATALYGSRAANGVIVITTKSGASGSKRNFTLEYNGGLQARQVSVFPEMQNEFGQGWNRTQTFIENGSWGPRFDGSLQNYGPIWNNHDQNFQQLMHEYSARENNVKDFFETGLSYNNSIALSGISEDKKSTYYMSYSNNHDNGIMPSNVDTYKRNNLSFNGNFEITNWLKVTPMINFSTSSTNIAGSYQGVSVIDGLYETARDVSIVDKKDLSSAFHTPEAYFTPYGITNPYWAIANNYNRTDAKKVYGKFQVDIKPIKELTLTYRYGFDYYDYDRKVGTPEINLDDALIVENYGYAPSEMNQAGTVYASYSRQYEINNDFLANYAKDFDKFSVNVFAGVNVNERYSTGMSGQADKLTYYTGFWDISNGSSWTTLTEAQSKYRLIGLLGDITLGYDDQIYLDLTARNDWSSTLPVGNNSYFYSGATLSWIFTKFVPENDLLSFGKFRLAYGKTGRDASPYQTSVRYIQAAANGYYGTDIAQFPMNGTNAFLASTTLGSSTLSPEMNSEVELGLNLQFLNGRVGIDAAYYNRIRDKQIFTLPIDPSTGYSSIVTNFGQVNNNGIEFLLSTTPVKTKDFRWDLDVNFAINRNKVISMPESLEGGKVVIEDFAAGNDAVYMYAEEGKPLGVFYTYLPQRVEDKNSPHYGKMIVDEYGQPVLSKDVKDTGYDMNNKWTGGVTTSFSAYGFTFSATLDARIGGYMFSRTKNLMQFTGNGIVTLYNDRNPFVLPNSVQEVLDDDDNVVPGVYQENTMPIYTSDGSYQKYFDTYGWGNGGNAYLVDRSFAKLRNISITYELPKKLLKSFSEVSISAFVNNAFVWTAADNYYIDPEASTSGTDLVGSFGELYVNPASRIYGCNLKVKF